MEDAIRQIRFVKEGNYVPGIAHSQQFCQFEPRRCDRRAEKNLNYFIQP